MRILLSVLVFLSFFPLLAPLNFGMSGFSFGINAYYLVGLLIFPIFILSVLTKALKINKHTKRIIILIFLLVLWSVFTSFFNPHLFNGIQVFSPRIGIDTQANYGTTSLRWTPSNFGQTAYLLINFSIVYLFLFFVKDLGTFRRVFLNTFNIIVPTIIILIIWQIANKTLGIYFPYDFIFSLNDRGQLNQTINGLYRINGTMIEPSVMGGAMSSLLIVSLWLQTANNGLRYKIYPILIIASIIATASTTGIFLLTMLLTFYLVIFFSHAIFNLKISLQKTKFLILLACIFSASYVLLIDTINLLLDSVLFDKLYSSSLENRSISNKHTFEIMKNTHGLGAGLGSNRPSSLIAAIISNLGFIGFILSISIFSCIVHAYFSFRKHNRDIDYTFWTLMIFLISMSLAIPDLSTEYLWICLSAFLVNLNIIKIKNKKTSKEQY